VRFKVVAFVVLAAVLAALFVRLGFWQLRRLAERRARNVELAARLAAPVVPFERLEGGDTGAFRRVAVTGTPDYEHDILFTGRSRNGSPGVYILTPVRRASSDTAVVVIRGWVYAPDAATIDRALWRERRDTFAGYVNVLPPTPPVLETRANERKLRNLSVEGVQAILPYPVSDRYVVSQDSAVAGAPARLPLPSIDNGPHLSYAIQWFAFATIALIGGAIVLFWEFGSRGPGSTGA
jgi:surfeit locus 1 family protein